MLHVLTISINCYETSCISLFLSITQTITESGCRLYKVSGTGILSMKAVEVIPKASSLHSGHAYILLGPHGEYVWSGQFSNQAQRRGALLVAKALNKSKSVYHS